jgi:hypothetical protein
MVLRSRHWRQILGWAYTCARPPKMQLLLVLALSTASSTLGFMPPCSSKQHLRYQGKLITAGQGAVVPTNSILKPMIRRQPLGGCRMAQRGGPAAEWDKYARTGLEMPLSSKRQPEGPLDEDPSLPMIEDIIRAADDRKAQSIWAVRVAHLTYSTEFFINVQGSSRPMLQVSYTCDFLLFW